MGPTAFVGTYTAGDSEGIYHFDVAVDGDPPALERTGVTAVGDDPSFLAVGPDESTLYAVHEVPAGGASAFRIETGDESATDAGTATLSPLGRVESGAGGPCHCSVHPSGEFLFVAHYTGAAVSALPVRTDGSLGEPTDVVAHEGSSERERQDQAHPHSITPGPNGRFVYVPDLGTDEVVVYEFDDDAGALERVDAVEAEPGAGPRHLDFHPDRPLGYLINELDSTLTAYEWDADTGALTEVETVSTLPDGFDGDNLTADVHVHPSGEWVYGSNRGHDSIARFAVEADGAPDFRGTVPTGGEWPRNFAVHPGGTALFAENKDTDDIHAFRIDADSGALDPVESVASVPQPVCLVFVDVE